MPIVLIDQDSDSDATIVQVSFGDRLGALIDTVKSPSFVCLSSRFCFFLFQFYYLVSVMQLFLKDLKVVHEISFVSSGRG